MTSVVQLHSLNPKEINAWNTVDADEQILDITWWHQPHRDPRSNVRLRFCQGRLVHHSPVPATERSSVQMLAIVPPLVNPHTHLEFSAQTRPILPASPFPDWVRSVIAWRIEHAVSGVAGVGIGLQECKNHAVSAVGEITTSDDALARLQTSMVDIVSFRELIGLLPDHVPNQIDMMNHHLEYFASSPQRFVRPGISPHAPYSVHPDLVTAATEAGCRHSIPVAMHLGETREELELLDSGTGAFVDFLQQMDLWDSAVLPQGSTILRYLHQLAKLPRSLAIHCNYLTDQEIRFLGQHPRITVVYCPRTHHFFGHQSHPWQRIQAAGGSVVLGTDGRSSNPDLSIWKELQFLAARTTDATSVDLLPMITTQAALALGFEDHQGSNTGFHGTAIMLPAESRNQPEAILSPGSRPVARLVSSGDRVKLLLCEPPDEHGGK